MRSGPGLNQISKCPFRSLLFAGLIILLVGYGCSTPDSSGGQTFDEPSQQDSQPTDAIAESAPTATEVIPTEPPSPTPGISENMDWQPVNGQLGDQPMVFVPEGCFMMGSSEAQIETAMQACPDLYSGAPFPCDPSGYQTEGPRHEVCLEAYWIGQTEVTNSQYAACVEAGVCSPPADRTFFDDPAYADHPVIQVAWPDAKAYAEWVGGRLPTEAEWEYAARGPSGWVYPWGDEFEKDRLNYCDVNCDVYFWSDPSYDDGYALIAPVGTYPGGVSWVGALDMSGNAWEWVSSIYQDYPYDAFDGREDPAADGDHVLRGGAFDLSYLDLRSAFRYVIPAGGVCRGYGFRVAADAEALPAP